MNFKGIKFTRDKYGPFVIVKPKISYKGFVIKNYGTRKFSVWGYNGRAF